MSLPATKATTATATHAVVQAVETYIQNQNLLGEIAELDELLCDLIDQHKDNGLALKRVLQCIYNLLQDNNKYNVKFGSKAFHKLISIVIADSTDEDDASPQSLHRQLVANVLICVQVHARKFPRIDGKFLLEQLWSLSLSNERQPHAAQILVQLFDDFQREMGMECACSAQLHLVIQNLMQSEQRESRKSAYFLMRKLLAIMQQENVDANKSSVELLDTLKCTDQQWSAYVTIMEILEEQQSHLILPTLHTLIPHVAEEPQEEEWLLWLRILYARLLQQNNILVLRWSLAYFLGEFNVTKLNRVKLLAEFLAATNRTQLYNVEGDFVPFVIIRKFVPVGEEQVFLEALATVSWHAVPLLFWLQNLDEQRQFISCSKNVLLQLSSKVRTLKHIRLRERAIERLLFVFKDNIDNLSLGDYLLFIETLFNVSDSYLDFDRFTKKLRECENFGDVISHFNKRCFEIIVNESYRDNITPEVIKQLSQVQKDQHGWCRLFPLFYTNLLDEDNKQIVLDFYSTVYNVNMEIFLKSSNISELQEHLIQQLNCQTREEKSFVLKRSVDWFVVHNLKKWSQIKEFNLSPVDLLEDGTKYTFIHLAALLNGVKTRLDDDKKVLQSFVVSFKKDQKSLNAIHSVVKYAAKHLNYAENNELILDMIKVDDVWAALRVLEVAKNLQPSFFVSNILAGEACTGDARIEDAYYYTERYSSCDDLISRNNYISTASSQPRVVVRDICAELQRINKELTAKKPRYFENCKEHRIKIRIARALLMLKQHIRWSDEMWTSVMEPNDQLNISFMYECLVGMVLPRVDILLDKLRSLKSGKPSQQAAIISVAHIYCLSHMNKIKPNELQEIICWIFPHTMGPHFQIRTFAQMVILQIGSKFDESGYDLPKLDAVFCGIQMVLIDKMPYEDHEPRLALGKIVLLHSSPADAILYMTNAPFDEYDRYPLLINKRKKVDLEMLRYNFRAKKNLIPVNEASQLVNLNVQRKMNPTNDIFNAEGIGGSEEKLKKKELIVVGSLIDKLPNLGGLARTCEVLGVNTLTLSSRSDMNKSDFINLSMTAEKTLNIVELKPADIGEFLIKKQSMGYKVVGAEQTAQSVSFVDFKFPEKCILILGHEKHGIPVDIIALLDYAVEIPQFGVVRSLNVHVTGSIFIWEYCKQHLNN